MNSILVGNAQVSEKEISLSSLPSTIPTRIGRLQIGTKPQFRVETFASTADISLWERRLKKTLRAFADASPPTLSQSVYVGVIQSLMCSRWFCCLLIKAASFNSQVCGEDQNLITRRLLKLFFLLSARVRQQQTFLSSWALLSDVWYCRLTRVRMNWSVKSCWRKFR